MMNIVQGVNFQVKDPVTIKDFSDSQPGSMEIFKSKENSADFDNSKKIDFSQFSEEDRKKLDEELERHNKEFAFTGKYLKFKYNEELKTSIVEVINSKTHEVIVSLPPEFLIDLSIKMKKILGLHIDEKL